MIVVLAGPDSYRRGKRQRELFSAFFSQFPNAAEMRVDDVAENAFEQVHAFLRAGGLFGSAKALLLRALPFSKEQLRVLLQEADKGNSLLLCISLAAIPSQHQQLVASKKYHREEFPLLRGAAWQAFVREEAQQKGVVLDDEAFHFLAAFYEGESWMVATELEKLRYAGKATITLGDIGGSRSSSSLSLPRLLRSIAFSASLRERVSAMEQLLASGESAAKIFHLLAYYNKSRVHEFARYDIAVKSGKLEYEEALVYLTLRGAPARH
ncbi:hypothetical protein D6779_07970 [Candidatus Parcubacteria bacterium]|nr:MAG: hypothetical protein D6779_07970 [Candidatus Parcubacteria bacterium]